MVYLLVALLVLSADLIIKSKIVEIPETGFPIEKCNGKIKFVRAYNEGMANNLMEQEPDKVKKISSIVLIVFTILSLPMLFSKKTRKIRKFGIGLIIGGAASNVADRYVRGKVVDYVQFDFGKSDRISRMTYNLADFCIIAGTIMYGLGKRKKKKRH